jgi:hypothetical protein
MVSLLSSVCIALVACYYKLILLTYIQIQCQFRLCKADHVYITYLSYKGSLVTWTVLSMVAAKFKPFLVSMSRFAFYFTENRIYFHEFAWLLFVVCKILFYIGVHTEGWKPYANRGPMYAYKNVQWCGEYCSAGVAVLRRRCLLQISRWSKQKPLLRSISLWRWYVSLTITILDIVHIPVFYLKHHFTETEFCFRLQVEPTQRNPIDRASLCFQTKN